MGSLQGRLGVVEFATSGTDPDTDRIVAARIAVVGEDGVELVRWDWAPDRGDALIGEVAQTLRALHAAAVPLAVYDAIGGLTILDRECRRRYLAPLPDLSPVLDPLLLDHLLEPALGEQRPLGELAQRYGVAGGSLLAGRLARVMAERLDGTLDELHARQRALLDGWPIAPLEDIRLIEDTQPFPAPPPRPSESVPTLDFGSEQRERGMLELESVAPIPDLTPEVSPRVSAAATGPAGAPRRIHVAAAIVTDSAGRALVVRKRGTTGFMQPGGKIERGESALACLVRELREELGLEVVADETEFLGSFEADALNEPGERVRAEVFALVTDAPVAAGAEIDEVHWLSSPTDIDAVELAPLTLDVMLPLWASRRPALF